ncbi:MAG: ribonuclease P protein component [Bacteroidales bacterium]|nr:ribonuclease P protein component [Bacteroidales bacterium]
MSDFRLRKSEKLCDDICIAKLFTTGKTIKDYPLFVHYLEVEQEDEALKVLFSIPKKKIKSAVKRNLLKRRIRESYRLNKQDIRLLFEQRKSTLLFSLVWSSKEILPYKEIEKKIIAILARLSGMHEKNIR